MLVYYFVPFIVSNRYLLFWVSNGHNSVTVQNRTHVYINFFHHKDLGNHLLQLSPKVVKHPVYSQIYWVDILLFIYSRLSIIRSDGGEGDFADNWEKEKTKTRTISKNLIYLLYAWRICRLGLLIT